MTEQQKSRGFLGAASFGKEGAVGSNLTPRTIDERYTLHIFHVLWQPKKDDYPENMIAPIGRRLRDLTTHIDLNNLDEHAHHS